MREKLARGRGGGMYSVVGLVEGGGGGGGGRKQSNMSTLALRRYM